MKYVMRCAIWYHLDILKNVKNTHGGVLILVLKLTLLHGCFSRFLNCTNRTKSRSAPHMVSSSVFYWNTVFRWLETLAKTGKSNITSSLDFLMFLYSFVILSFFEVSVSSQYHV